MKITEAELIELRHLIQTQVTSEDGPTSTALKNVLLFQSSKGQARQHEVYQPYFLILAQGEKHLYIDGNKYHFKAGDFLTVLMPMCIEANRTPSTKENPYLMCCIELDLIRVAKILSKIETHTNSTTTLKPTDASAFHLAEVDSNLLSPVLRILSSLQDPVDTAILGESTIDEIYLRLLTNNEVGLGSIR